MKQLNSYGGPYIINKINYFNLGQMYLGFTYGVFGCEKKVWREKNMRKSMKREKYVRNKVELTYCLVQENKERNRRERSVFNFEKTKISLHKKINAQHHSIVRV